METTANELQIGFDEYCQIDRMNASTLVHGCKSMLSLKRAIDGGQREPTPAMQFGNKYHTLVLEPEEFEATYCVMPNFATMPGNMTGNGTPSTSWGTKFCKERKEEFEAAAECAGRKVITREQYDRGLAMCEAIATNEFASQLIAEGRKESTLLGEISGVPFKCRLDLRGGDSITDLKGTNNAAAVAFGRTAANLHYGFKLAIYREVYCQHFDVIPAVYLIAVETDGDFDCCVYQMPEDMLDAGLKEVWRVLEQYKRCLDEDKWPGVDQGESPVPLFVPNWAMPEDDNLEWD